MQHSKAIRELAVARIRGDCVPLLELAREYGVSTNTLRAWLRESNLRLRTQEETRRIAATLSVQAGDADTEPTPRDRLLIHALEHSPATIIVTDTEGRIAYANPKFVETTGYSLDEAIGKNPRILKSGATSSLEYRKLWKTILSGKEWRGNFRNRRKDGSLYWERASISPVFNHEGRITHFMAVKEDVTELVEAEIASRQTAATYAAMFAALPMPLLLMDGKETVRYANPAIEALFDTPIPPDTRFGQLNLRWVDRDCRAIQGAEHPLARLLADDADMMECRSRIGIIPPTGGVSWIDIFLQRIALPDVPSPLVMLCVAPWA